MWQFAVSYVCRFALAEGARVQSRVVDESHAPVPNAHVYSLSGCCNAQTQDARPNCSDRRNRRHLPTGIIRVLRPTCALPLRSEEHTSELQSHHDLVCRLLLEKK